LIGLPALEAQGGGAIEGHLGQTLGQLDGCDIGALAGHAAEKAEGLFLLAHGQFEGVVGRRQVRVELHRAAAVGGGQPFAPVGSIGAPAGGFGGLAGVLDELRAAFRHFPR
jgi:hypothetical protein